MSLSAVERIGLATLLFTAACSTLSADPLSSAPKTGYQQVELFEAIEREEVSVKVHVRDAQQLNIAIENHTDRPLAVQMPDAFAAVPVLAQFQPGGLQQFNQGNNTQNQATGAPGGPFNQNQGNQGNNGLNNPGIFNVPPGKIVKAKQPCVCLEHGKEDPNPRLDYEIRPIDSVLADEQVARLVQLLVLGTDQRVVQLAVWHRANGVEWEELAALKIDRLRGPDTRQYSSREIAAAEELLEQVAESLKGSEDETTTEEVTIRPASR